MKGQKRSFITSLMYLPTLVVIINAFLNSHEDYIELYRDSSRLKQYYTNINQEICVPNIISFLTSHNGHSTFCPLASATFER